MAPLETSEDLYVALPIELSVGENYTFIPEYFLKSAESPFSL